MKKQEYRILHVEDSPVDVDLVKRVLKKEGLNCQYFIAETKESFIQGLKEFNPDIILCDHSLPKFDSVLAFEIYKEINPEIAFLLVTGSVSEEYAVEMMKRGIDDYLLKDNLQRLPNAIENAFAKREKERLRKQAEAKLAQSEKLLNKAQQIAHIGSLEYNIETHKEIWSNEVFRILGISPGDIEPSKEALLSFIHPNDLEFVKTNIKQANIELRDMSFYTRIIRKDGAMRYVYFESKFEFNKQEKPIMMQGILQDKTEKVIAEQEREFESKNLSALINNTNDLMWSVGRDFNLITSNQAFDEVVIRMIGKPIARGANVFPPEFSNEQLARFKRYYDRAFSGQAFTEIENSGETWSEISFFPICKENKVVGTACFSRDITERKQVEIKLSKFNTELIDIKNELEHSELRLKQAQAIAHIGNWELDFKSGIALWSDEARRIYGLPLEENKQSYESWFSFIHPEDRDFVLKKIKEAEASLQDYSFYHRIVRKDGTVKHIYSQSHFELNAEGKPTGLYGVAQDVTEQKMIENEILQKNEQLKNLTSHLQQVREEERTTISREIHDELGQQLTALKMDIDWVKHKQNNPDEAVVSKLQEMLKMSDGIINTIRRISSDLRPAIIDDLGLIAALEWKCNDFEEKMGIPCQFISNVKERKFENHFGINAFRILQESLTNVSRHAAAKSVTVSVSENETELLLEIADDGKGISNERIGNGKTLGIVGMKERAALLGGELIIEGEKNKGTRTKLILPLKK